MEMNQAQDEEGELVVVSKKNTEMFMVVQYVKELKKHLRAVNKVVETNRDCKFFGSTSAPLNDDELVEIKAKTFKKNKKLSSSLPVPARGKGRARATSSERVSNTKALEVLPTAVLESADEDETYKPGKYLKKRLNEARSTGTRRSQRVRKPVDRLKL
ncbi:hypothetical protein BpHYR1_039397 [Brachionus plicatilis]|uniref:Uncharacterized protein n=1 Tax=Brachionus plicatilis TaxID=10195 RepID=A0A3M7SUN1_BRAPC|nr:hypothetical protein BpHYR1_039397 [Brachionus plicatilis]